MNIYTVCFFGHRYIERGTEISDRLDKLLHDLITQKEYVDFLIGRDGDFDLLASADQTSYPQLRLWKYPFYARPAIHESRVS